MSVLKKYVPSHPLLPSNIHDVKEQLRRALQDRVEEAYVFGSAATGNYHCASDIDLILLKDYVAMPFRPQLEDPPWQPGAEDFIPPFPVRGQEFLDLFDIYPNLDILVYTRREFESMLATPGPGFWQSVRETKQRLL